MILSILTHAAAAAAGAGAVRYVVLKGLYHPKASPHSILATETAKLPATVAELKQAVEKARATVNAAAAKKP